MLDGMAHEFASETVEEFYNSCHSRDSGKFCGVKAKGKKVLRVPMSDAARRSNAVLRRLSADRKSKEYKRTQARLENTKRGPVKKAGPKAAPNRDKSAPLRGKYKTTGNRGQDAINLTRLDRGSPERKAAAKAFQAAYGGK
jgi:hypothetical protein